MVTVTPKEALDRMAQGAVYLDVRSEPEFAEGRPQGAVNVPWLRFAARGLEKNPDFVSAVKARLDVGASIVVGCRSGGRAASAAEALLREGYANLAVCRAGWDGVRDSFGSVVETGWLAEGLPVEAD